MPPEVQGSADIRILADDPGAGDRLAARMAAMGLPARMGLPAQGVTQAALVIALLPDDGCSCVRELRQRDLRCPLLVVGSPDQPAMLLQAGADAALAMDAADRELSAHVRALVRRAGAGAPANRAPIYPSVLGEAQLLKLTPTEQRILEVLARRPGRVVTRDLIVDTLYAGADAPRSTTVDVFVHGLRRKLDKGTGGMRIETVRGAGFKLAMS